MNNSLLLVVLKNKELIQLKLSDDGTQVLQQNIYLVNTYGRLRDVVVIPDGRVFICTSNKDYAGSPGATDDRIIELKNPAAMSVQNQAENSSVRLYPMPAKNVLHVDTNTKFSSYQLVNSLGRQVSEGVFTPQINVSELTSGLYILQLLDANQKVIERKKVLIE